MASATHEEEVTTTAVETTATETEHETTTETAHEDASGPAAVLGTFGLRGDMFAAQLVNFLIVLVVLWRFAYKPIMKKLAEREQLIAKSVHDAEAMEKRMAAFEVEHQQMLATARKEAQDIVTQAMAQSEERRVEMIEAAKREVERVIAKGKQQLVTDREEMLRDVRKEIVDIAMKAAARILHEGVTEKKSQSLAEEIVRKMT